MSKNEERLVPARGGWVEYVEPPGTYRKVVALLRLDWGGRLRVRSLAIESTDWIDGQALRSVKLGRIEALANSPRYRDWILERYDEDLVLKWEPKDPKRKISNPTAAQHLKNVRRRPSLRIHVPDEVPYPNSFYERVADAYGAAAAYSDRPAVDIAEKSGVPVERVHGWIKGARKRGLLAPGRKRGKES
jgi:hypothetical protein